MTKNSFIVEVTFKGLKRDEKTEVHVSYLWLLLREDLCPEEAILSYIFSCWKECQLKQYF